jgi:drug/metabolite transporter (DMT)-like permease
MSAQGHPMTRARALVALHVAALCFGATGVIGAWLALPAAEITEGRCVVAALTLAVVLRRRGERLVVSRALVFNGLLLAAHWTAFFAAVEAGGVAVGALGYASFPLFVVLLERALAGRALDRASMATVALVFAGLATMALPGVAVEGLVPGLALGVLSGASFAWLSVRVRLIVGTLPPVALALGQCAFAALWLAPLTMLAAGWRAPTPGEWAGIAILGVVCTALAHTLFIGAMRIVSAHTASVVVALEPVYAIVLAAALLRQVPGAAPLAGGALIVAAAFVAPRRRDAPVPLPG